MPKKSGFTLVELLVVIAIIAILSAIGMVIFTNVMKQGRDSKRQSDLSAIQSALEQFFNDQFYYPLYNNTTCSTAGMIAFNLTTPCKLTDPGNTKTYINNIPTDPTGSPQYLYEPLPSFPTACDNVNIKCTSYCLYAKLERTNPTPPPTCINGGTRNFALTPP